LLLAFWASPAFSYDPLEYQEEQGRKIVELEGVGITEHLGTDLNSLNVPLIDETGKTVQFHDFLTQGRPVLVSLVYYSCPSLCNLHLNGVLDALKQLSLKPGRDYDFIAVSFDPKEKFNLAAAKKKNYLEKYQLAKNADGIHFLTGDENSVKILAEAVGFKYKWMDNSKEWAHASAAVVVTPDGTVARYLHGVYFEPKTMRLSIVEASHGKVGDLKDSIILFCYRYDPHGSKYAIYSWNVMRAACVLVFLGVMIWLLPFWLRQRRKTI